MLETQLAALTGSGCFPTERMCVTAFITLETRVGLSDRKHLLIQVSGAWVNKGFLFLFMYITAQVLSAQGTVRWLVSRPFYS